MVDETYIVSGLELNQFGNTKKAEVVGVLKQLLVEYPNVQASELLEYAETNLINTEGVVEWDYNVGGEVIHYYEDLEQVTQEPVEAVSDPAPGEYEQTSEEPVVEEELEPYVNNSVEEELTGDETDFEDTFIEEDTVAPYVEPTPELEPEPEVVEEPEILVEEDFFANQNPVISRQRKWRGLLKEAGKLDV